MRRVPGTADHNLSNLHMGDREGLSIEFSVLGVRFGVQLTCPQAAVSKLRAWPAVIAIGVAQPGAAGQILTLAHRRGRVWWYWRLAGAGGEWG